MTTANGRSPLRRDLKIRTRVTAAARALRTPAEGEAQPASGSPADAAAAPIAESELLSSTPLFDVAWYSSVAGCKPERSAAVRHYLKSGHKRGLSPHPLFDPGYYASRVGEEARQAVPFLLYLSRAGSADVSPSPLFEARAYADANPAAIRHPHGVLGHYLQEGAAAGARPNEWYTPGADALPDNLADWVRARRTEWEERRLTANEASSAESAQDVRGPGHEAVDWDALAARPALPDLVSVIISTTMGWWRIARTVQRVAEEGAGSERQVQIIVLDDGCGPETSVMLDSLPLRFPGVTVAHRAVDRGFGLSRNQALQLAMGGVVVFLDQSADVGGGWLEPLVTALEDPEILGVQPLLRYPKGLIRSAGVAFPSCGGLPHMLLEGFPLEDAAGLESASFSALSPGAVAMRFTDLVAVQGFDPDFRTAVAGMDLGLRIRRSRPGRFSVRPETVVVIRDSKASAHDKNDRRLFVDRWGSDAPGDDVVLWQQVGFDVQHYDAADDLDEDSRLTEPAPVLTRRPRACVVEGRPSLRWALKIPALPDDSAEIWGDTHFARRLAEALRRLGQDVVIDHRLAFTRRTRQFDDVALGIRGVEPYPPIYGQVNLLWLISHPEMLTPTEARSYDRVFAASYEWAARTSRAWGVRIDPLLQATDPALFNPDRGRPDSGHPLLFVGRGRDGSRPIVMGAIEQKLPVAVYGLDWEPLIPEANIQGSSLPNIEVGAAYRAAGVVLNDHWEEMRVDGFISNRLFDAVASGARVVTDDVAGLGDMFGRSVQVARTTDDLVRLTTASDLDAIFGGDDERRAVAGRVQAEHSFDARARELLDVALKVRSSMSASRRTGQDAEVIGSRGPET
jgi:hypothetical protein